MGASTRDSYACPSNQHMREEAFNMREEAFNMREEAFKPFFMDVRRAFTCLCGPCYLMHIHTYIYAHTSYTRHTKTNLHQLAWPIASCECYICTYIHNMYMCVCVNACMQRYVARIRMWSILVCVYVLHVCMYACVGPMMQVWIYLHEHIHIHKVVNTTQT